MTVRPAAGRLYLAIVLLFLLTTALAGCTTGEEPPSAAPVEDPAPPVDPNQPVEGGILDIGLWYRPDGRFNPLLAEWRSDLAVLRLVYEPLLRLDESLDWQPGIADEIAVDESGRSLTVRLNPNASWQDGQPVTSRDLVTTLSLLLAPDFPGSEAVRQEVVEPLLAIEGARAYRAGEAGAIRGLVAEDEQTLKIALSEPGSGVYRAVATLRPIPAHLYEGMTAAQLEEKPAGSASLPVGNGPFRFEAVEENEIRLVRNPGFYRGSPHLDGVTFHVIDREVAVGQLQTGDLDLVQIRSADAAMARDVEGLQLLQRPSGLYQYLGVNLRHPALREIEVRRSLDRAIDRQRLIDAALDGYGLPLQAPVIPGSWADPGQEFAGGKMGETSPGFDPEEARRLLEEAGWVDSDGDGVRERQGRRLSLLLVYPADDGTGRDKVARLIQEDLAAIGVEVELRGLPREEAVAAAFQQKAFDLYLMGWGLDLWESPAAIFGSEGPYNAMGWRDPENDRLLVELESAATPAAYREAYRRWAGRVAEEKPYLFLYISNEVYAIHERVRGLRPNLLEPTWNVEEWWIVED